MSETEVGFICKNPKKFFKKFKDIEEGAPDRWRYGKGPCINSSRSNFAHTILILKGSNSFKSGCLIVNLVVQ